MFFTAENMPSHQIVYIRRIGPYGIDNVQTMEKIKDWARSNSLLNEESIILGIAHDNLETTQPENCRYDTCFVVSDEYTVVDDLVSQGHIAGGKYVVFKIDHTAQAVEQAWNEIFLELSKHGYTFDDSRPIIERYITKMVNNHFCEICVPVL